LSGSSAASATVALPIAIQPQTAIIQVAFIDISLRSWCHRCIVKLARGQLQPYAAYGFAGRAAEPA
jgi:hypothetical protein